MLWRAGRGEIGICLNYTLADRSANGRRALTFVRRVKKTYAADRRRRVFVHCTPGRTGTPAGFKSGA